MIDRDGVLQGKQYVGFKQLPATTSPTLPTADAARIILAYAGESLFRPADLLQNVEGARKFVRIAKARTHPDRENGSAEGFASVSAAAAILSAHHGTGL